MPSDQTAPIDTAPARLVLCLRKANAAMMAVNEKTSSIFLLACSKRCCSTKERRGCTEYGALLGPDGIRVFDAQRAVQFRTRDAAMRARRRFWRRVVEVHRDH